MVGQFKKVKQHEGLIVMVGLLLFLLFNFYIPSIFADDLGYASRVAKQGYIHASIDHYYNWSSRIIIEFVLMFLAHILYYGVLLIVSSCLVLFY